MPSNTCVVVGCDTNYKDTHTQRHRFPKDLVRFNVWVERSGNPKLINLSIDAVAKSFIMCDKHFDETCRSSGFKRLNRNAMPTLNLPEKTKIVNCISSSEKSMAPKQEKDCRGLKRTRTKKKSKTLNDPALCEHDKDKSKQDIDNSGAEQTCSTVTDDIVEIAIKQLVVQKKKDSLFDTLKGQKNVIVLPNNWYRDVSYDFSEIPLTITFFKLNNPDVSSILRYLEKQVVLNQDSKITFFVNGKNVMPIDFGLKNYREPSDILSLQSLIQEFNNINICQGIRKKNLNDVKLNVFENTDRWWHPKCSNISADTERFLCYSCQVLNNVLLKITGRKKCQQRLPLDNTI